MPVLALAAGGCAGVQSIVDPAGPSARAIAAVWWAMFGGALLVFAAVVALWLVAMRRRGVGSPITGAEAGVQAGAEGGGRAGAAAEARAARVGRRWIVGGGIVLPSVAVTALLVFGSPAALHQLPLEAGLRLSLGLARDDGQDEPLRIEAIGSQWRWELVYAGGAVRLVDELRLPVGRPVDITTSSRDVIHSFWVPSLGGKLDAIPGRRLVVRLQADRIGTFRGQCAEFCGLAHAQMSFVVRTMAAADFDAWLAGHGEVVAEAGR